MNILQRYWLFCRHHPRLMGGCVGAYALTLCALLCVIVTLVPHQAKASALAHVRTLVPVQVSLEEIRGPSLDPGFEWAVMSIPATTDGKQQGRRTHLHHVKHQYPAQAHGLSLITANLVWAPPGRVFEGGEPAMRLVMAQALRATDSNEYQSAAAYSGSPAANVDVEQAFALMTAR